MSVRLVKATAADIAKAMRKAAKKNEEFANNLKNAYGTDAPSAKHIRKDFRDEFETDVFKKNGKLTKEGKSLIKGLLKESDLPTKMSVKDYIKDLVKKQTAPYTPVTPPPGGYHKVHAEPIPKLEAVV